jgi:hypothetical protein
MPFKCFVRDNIAVPWCVAGQSIDPVLKVRRRGVARQFSRVPFQVKKSKEAANGDTKNR